MTDVIEVIDHVSHLSTETHPPTQVTVNQAPVQVVEVSGIAISGDGARALESHVNSPTPHPHYDDLPSLKLLFENGII